MQFFIRFGLFFIAFLGINSNFSWASGIAKPWQMGFQEPSSPLMEHLNSFHHELIYIIFAVSIVVMLLLAYVIFKFNARKNKVPSRTTHNTLIEIVWTVVPILILLFIAVPSIKVLKNG